jgi:RNA polymerase sigma factor (sigma-70 family)
MDDKGREQGNRTARAAVPGRSRAVPKTSTTMLRQIAGEAEHPRWAEFVARYRPMLEAFARERFPGVEADDLIQDTLVGVMKALPGYVSREDRPGAFHNFLTGVLRHKAIDALRKAGCRAEAEALAGGASGAAGGGAEREEEAWRKTVYEVALGQLMGNPRVGSRSKQIFRRTAMRGEKPQEVAESLGVARGVVDLTKRRMTERLREIIEKLKAADV